MKRRKARSVGTRPAEVCGCRRKPHSSRSESTFRMLAGERSMPCFFESVRDPTGSPVETNSVMQA